MVFESFDGVMERMSYRRFPPPWSVEKRSAYFIIRENGWQKLAGLRLGAADSRLVGS